MLMRTDPFRDLDRLTQQLIGTASRPSAMAMDAWRDGDEFEMLKFRSMRVGTHEGIMSDPCQRARFEVAEFKLPANDPRITSAGRVIRRLSLDEIPQLVNVLRSEMSLVGIRAVERSQLDMVGGHSGFPFISWGQNTFAAQSGLTHKASVLRYGLDGQCPGS